MSSNLVKLIYARMALADPCEREYWAVLAGWLTDDQDTKPRLTLVKNGPIKNFRSRRPVGNYPQRTGGATKNNG